MEIIKRFDEEEVERIMEERGYDKVSVNMNGDIISSINFVKSTDLNVGLHAQVHMKSHTIEITMVQLKFMCHLRTGFFDFFHPQFEKYEKIIYLYSEACLGLDDVFQRAEAMPAVTAVVPGQPPKLILSASLTKPEEGSIEYDGNHLYLTKDGVRTTYVKLQVDKDTIKKVKKTIEERKKTFWMELMPIAKQKGLSKEFALDFYRYWTEHGPNDKTFRKELQQKFDISRRMDTFVRNDRKWSKTFKDHKAEKQDAALTVTKEMPNHKDLF